MLEVRGNSFIVTGDDHYDDLYRGAHLNYQANCYDVMRRIENMQEHEQADLMFRTGDFIGARPNVSMLEDHNMIYQVAKHLKNLSAPVVINKGNHDLFGDESRNDYIMLSRLGYFYAPEQFADSNGNVVKLVTDYTETNDSGEEVPVIIYIHVVPYGKDMEKLHPVKDAINIAITHGDFCVGSETISQNPDAIDLVTHEPFFGIDYIINGHIHEPHSRITYQTTDGSTTTFLNVGCPTRVKRNENYEAVYYFKLSVDKDEDGDVVVLASERILELSPSKDLFITKKDSAVVDAVKEDKEKASQELSLVFEDLKDFTFKGISLEERVDIMVAEPDVKKLVLQYLKK